MIDHQPYVSIDQAKEIAQQGNAILVTTWLDSPAIMDLFPRFFYNDHEIYWSDHFSHLLDQYLAEDRIVRIAVTNKLARMWHLMRYEKPVDLIPIWLDRDYWMPKPSSRVPLRIGFMVENTYKSMDARKRKVDALAQSDFVCQHCNRAGFNVEMFLVGGQEAVVLEQMQSCDLYVGMGIGKHPLWGEGGPAMHLEAMLAGAVVIAFDSGGNHEYLLDGYTGFMVPRGDIRALTSRVVDVLRNPTIKERVREEGSRFAAHNFTSQIRWPRVARYLGLQEVSDEFTRSFGFD